MSEVEIPEAKVETRRAPSLFWFVPMLALVVAGVLGWRAYQQRGVTITLQFEDGHGVEAGDALRYRGIRVGTVTDVELAEGASAARVRARLRNTAHSLAVRGTRFWIVRPEIGFNRVAGLETVVGPRYLAISPPAHRDPDAELQRFFVGLDRAPLVERERDGDLEIVLTASRRRGLGAGSPLLYREMQIGVVLSVALSSDGGSVESRVHVDAAYAPLIRERSHFWKVGGFDATVGLNGVSFSFESAETVLRGGITVATPPDAGDAAVSGHRFELGDEPDDEWTDWDPQVAVGDSHLPASASRPTPLHAVLSWTESLFLRPDKDRVRSGWLLWTELGLLGPDDLLRVSEDDDAVENSAVLEIGGQSFALPESVTPLGHGLSRAQIPLEDGQPWPSNRTRPMTEAEDCLAIGDPGRDALPLSTNRLHEQSGRYVIDEAVSVDPLLHGAAITSSRDGALIGILIVGEDENWITPVRAAADTIPPG